MGNKLINCGIGVLVAIPIIIAKIKSGQPEENVRTPSPYEVDVMIAQNETETPTVEEIIKETVKVPEIVTEEAIEVPTEAVFSGYDFIPLDEGLQVQIQSLCEQYEIAYNLVLSVIKTESEFQVDVIGDNGDAIGLMQIQPKWWKGLADDNGLDIYEPIDNVHLGILILNKALDDNAGDLNKALKQYNSGNPNYAGNEYVEKVFNNYKEIEGELSDVDR
jgi:hypothetical protein